MILTLYRMLAPLLAALLPLAARFSPKMAASLAWRKERPFTEKDRLALAPRTPRFWVHAASAGELEQARPIMKELRRRHPDGAILLTLSSVSARKAADGVAEADCVIPLPLDTARAMGQLLDAVSPTAVLMVKWDLWPNLLREAARREIPTFLMGGVLSASSGRARWPGRLLTRRVHELLTGVGAASEEDARFFRMLNVSDGRLAISGDTRFDRVAARKDESRDTPLPSAADARPRCLIAGSTWRAEEEMLLAAFASLRTEFADMSLLLVPHEPTPAHLAHLAESATALDLPLWRLSERAEIAAGGICVVDRIGILPELYGLGDLALVGGGFGAGIHSVLEPAAYGLPVLMGPGIDRADEARRLCRAGGGIIFNNRDELLSVWRSFLDDPDRLRVAGEHSTAFIANGCGAVKRNLALLDRLGR
ncbi:MAG: hypothetical protein GY835_05915 [bacterium]|nr:hypothetical protein [bacterium]